jgi:broad specificity phosphatase PhoE
VKLVLVRHGQTHSNVAKRLDTLPPGAALTDRGRSQAESFGASLVARPVALVSSVALRAKETASFVGKATGVVNQVRDGLQETYAGEFEDRTDDDAHDRFQAVYLGWMGGDLDGRLPGGESAREVLARYVPVLDDLRTTYADSDGDVLVVSHGAAIRLVAQRLSGIDAEFAADNHLDNTETVELVPDGDSWRCVRWSTFTPPFENKGSRTPDDPMG